MTDLKFDYEALRYIELKGGGNKNPKMSWGGYDQDFDEAEHVHTHEEVSMYPDGREWGIVDVEDIDHASMALLIFDIDIHKAPDSFDASRIEVPSDTLTVKSQNGGIHVYFKLNGYQRGDLAESDFSLTATLPGEFDIDIRGSSVSMHVVAPSDIPGVGGDYEVVNNERIKAIGRPTEACERITLDGKPLLEFDQRTSVGDFTFDRPAESPDDMPACYHAGLELRKAAPDDHPNTHKVNVLTALCGLAAGYDGEEVASHFVNEWAPGNECDLEKTEYQVKHIERHLESGHYNPPSESSLRDYGILADGQSCDGDCPIGYHGPDESPSLDVVKEYDERRDAETEAEAIAGGEVAETDGGAAAADVGADAPLSDDQMFEREVQEAIKAVDDDEITAESARHRIAESFMKYYDFILPEEGVPGWRSTLYVYDPDEGVYEPRGDRFVDKRLEQAAADWATNQRSREVRGKIERRKAVQADALDTDPYRLVVGNGILDLRSGRLSPYTPTEYHTTKIDTEWNPDAECPEIDSFLHSIVDDSDVSTLYRLIAHTLPQKYIGEKAAMLLGDGQNGKTIFLNLIEQFIHTENVSHRELQDLSNYRFAGGSLLGKHANIAGDMSGAEVNDLSDFKKLTGGDKYEADIKNEDSVEFYNYATMMFSANEMPVFNEDNHGVWRRWIYLNFPYTFDGNDPDARDPIPERVLMERITDEEELEGLLVRCQNEIQDWWEDRDRDFFPSVLNPDEVRDKMKRAAEPIYNFASVCLEPDDDPDEDEAWLSKKEVRRCYREYASAEGLPKINEDQFGKRLVNLQDFPIESKRKRINGNRQYVYTGVSWSSRGRQVLGLDEPDVDDEQSTVDNSNSAKPKVLDIVRGLVEENDNEPVSRDMVIGAAMSEMGMGTAERALEELKKQGDVMQGGDGVIDT